MGRCVHTFERYCKLICVGRVHTSHMHIKASLNEDGHQSLRFCMFISHCSECWKLKSAEWSTSVLLQEQNIASVCSFGFSALREHRVGNLAFWACAWIGASTDFLDLAFPLYSSPFPPSHSSGHFSEMQFISLHVGMALVHARVRFVVLMLCGEAEASFQPHEHLRLNAEKIWTGADHFNDIETDRMNCFSLLHMY